MALTITPLLLTLLLSLTTAPLASANVEKTIFLGPDPVPIPLSHPTLDDLQLDTLTPSSPRSLRTRIGAKFPNSSHPLGESTWLLLDSLQKDKRYEVRVCWTATQPTSFALQTHELSAVFDSPELITSLWAYSTARLPADPTAKRSGSTHDTERRASVLLLQISAAADYFTTNMTLMEHPPLVNVDIILDPFLLNVLPESLLATIGYIIFVAAAAYLVSRRIVPMLHGIIATTTTDEASELKKEQ